MFRDVAIGSEVLTRTSIALLDLIRNAVKSERAILFPIFAG